MIGIREGDIGLGVAAVAAQLLLPPCLAAVRRLENHSFCQAYIPDRIPMLRIQEVDRVEIIAGTARL
jgi:hypothetical protein